MKVKFYKGPFHGKVKDIDIPPGGNVLMAVMDPKAIQQAYKLQPGSDITMVQPIGVRHVLYRIKVMSGEIAGQRFHSPAVHPDGSVFLEYVPDRKVKK
jgi:hypothetical protein